VPLVPVYSFGENDLCGTYAPGEDEAPFFHWSQGQVKSVLGIVIPFIKNIIPKPVQITTVFGKPIRPDPPQQPGQPTDEEVTALMARYEEALLGLFERHKEELAPNRAEELMIRD